MAQDSSGPGPYSLLSVRGVNNGRLAVLGVNPMWLLWSPYDAGLGQVVMKKGEQGKPSDWWKVLENTYRWLAEPSLQMGDRWPPRSASGPRSPAIPPPFPGAN